MIYDIIVGNGGSASSRWLGVERHLTRLPANITVKQMDTVESRLAALGSRAGAGVMPGTATRCAASSARSAIVTRLSVAPPAVAVSRRCDPSESVNSGGTTSPISRPRWPFTGHPATTTRPSISCPRCESEQADRRHPEQQPNHQDPIVDSIGSTKHRIPRPATPDRERSAESISRAASRRHRSQQTVRCPAKPSVILPSSRSGDFAVIGQIR